MQRVLTATDLIVRMRLRKKEMPDYPTWGDVLDGLHVSAQGDAQSELIQKVAPHAPKAWARFGGYTVLRARLERLLQLNADYAAAGASGSTLGMLQPPSGVLLYGPMGNGKSMLAKGLAAACGWPVLNVTGSSLYGKYVGETEANIRNIFRTARERAPSLIIFEDLDALGASRGGLGDESDAGGGSSVGERALSTLLNETFIFVSNELLLGDGGHVVEDALAAVEVAAPLGGPQMTGAGATIVLL